MVRVSGCVGELRHGYQVAAQLGRWSMVLLPQVPRRYQLEAEVAAQSDYWMAQRPLDLSLVVGTRLWRWRDVLLEVEGTRVRVTVPGMPEASEAPVMERSG